MRSKFGRNVAVVEEAVVGKICLCRAIGFEAVALLAVCFLGRGNGADDQNAGEHFILARHFREDLPSLGSSRCNEFDAKRARVCLSSSHELATVCKARLERQLQ